MKLWEAVATGRPFKRPCWDNYIKADLENNFIWVDTGTTRITRSHDFNFDDYEVEKEVITFEHKWLFIEGYLYPWQGLDYKIINRLSGKRTKITIEVLDD